MPFKEPTSPKESSGFQKPQPNPEAEWGRDPGLKLLSRESSWFTLSGDSEVTVRIHLRRFCWVLAGISLVLAGWWLYRGWDRKFLPRAF